MTVDIKHLEMVEQCRERAADEPSKSLRRIFDLETHNAGKASHSVGFSEIESSTYKRRCKQLPSLPSLAEDISTENCCNFLCTGQEFYRGSVSTQ